MTIHAVENDVSELLIGDSFDEVGKHGRRRRFGRRGGLVLIFSCVDTWVGVKLAVRDVQRVLYVTTLEIFLSNINDEEAFLRAIEPFF